MKQIKIIETKAEEIGERTIRFRISSEVMDRDGDILIAKGCDFTNFEKNPQFLGFHDSRDFPLGIPKKWYVEGKAVYADVYFPTIEELSTNPENASEKAKLVDFTYHCYKTGMLNAVSVGFIAKNAEPIKDAGYKITEWELLEFSAVAVPANQDAIAIARKSFGEDNAKMMITKSGRKISAETRKTLEAIKECNNKVKECQNVLKECVKEMNELLATFDEVEEATESEPPAPTEKPNEEPTTEKPTEEEEPKAKKSEDEIDLESIKLSDEVTFED